MIRAETALLSASLGGHLLLLTGTVWSLASPDRQIWPPPGRDTWQFWFTWILFIIATAGFVALGVVDWNALSAPAGLRYGLGGALVGGGLALAFWGIGSLGIEEALLWYLLLPRTEEPWLEERFGAAYVRYARRVPRFLGLPAKDEADGRGGGKRTRN